MSVSRLPSKGVRRPWRTAVVAVSGLVLSLGGTPAFAGGNDTGDRAGADAQSSSNINPHVLAVMRQQEKLNPAVTMLTQAAMADPDSGLASVAFEGDGLALYWKGALTMKESLALNAARKLGPVVVKAATYSNAELEAAAARLEKADPAGGSDIQTISINHDGSGLSVERMPADAATTRSAKVGRPLRAAADVISASGVGVPVRLSTASHVNQYLSCPSAGCNRRDDEAQWNSGDYLSLHYVTQGKWGHCTSGFGVNWPGQGTFMLTAAHCATWHAGGGDDAYDYTGEYIGRAMPQEDWDKDLILIDAPGWYWMFDGDPLTGRHKTVHSWGYWAAGEYLCQSGSTSGTVCGLQTIDAIDRNYGCDSDGDCFYVHGLIRVRQVNGNVAAQPGDSGAPVFSLDGDGVRAKGSVTAGSGNEMLFQDMADVTTSRAGAWNAVFPLTN